MATSGAAYGISVAIYTGVLIIIFILFSVWRRLALTRKFYAPKRFTQSEGYHPPPSLGESFLNWVPKVVRMNEAEVIGCAGIDAALYVKFLRMSWETFFLVSLLSLIIILPINLTSNEVSRLMNVQAAGPSPVSPYTYWVPPPPPPAPPGSKPNSTDDSIPQAPNFYNNTGIPDPPPGLEWQMYASDVPPLPPAPPGYVWQYSSDYTPSNYYFTDLDKVRVEEDLQRRI